MRTILASTFVALAIYNCALGDTFGSGANSFTIDFVTIGNPGNPADAFGSPNLAGSVANAYRIGKFEISEQMVDKANTLGGLGVTKDTRGPDKPATSVTWNEAARFVNWLDTSTGSPPAYKFALQPGEVGYSATANIQLWTPSDAGYNPNNLYRNSLAKYFLPSVNEWYKAAYYEPTPGIYYNFPTGNGSSLTPVASGTAAGTAVYNGQAGPADITLAGGLSPYGTMGQGGNVVEWEETDFDQVNGPDPSSSGRGIRGGFWLNNLNDLSSLNHFGDIPTNQNYFVGFRVASTPALVGITGDYNANGKVDAADYALWRNGGPLQNDSTPGVQSADYDTWRAHFGQGLGSSLAPAVPEPSTLLLGVAALVALSDRRRKTKGSERYL